MVLMTTYCYKVKRSPQQTFVGLEDVLKTSSEDEDERRLQDVFKTSSSRRMFAGSVHQRHLRFLMTKIYKSISQLNPEFMCSYFTNKSMPLVLEKVLFLAY